MVITTEPQNIAYGSPEFCQRLIEIMQEKGIHVIAREEVAEHFAVLDDELVWHGGMNLLGKEDLQLLKKELLQFLDDMELLAIKGKFDDTGNSCLFFIYRVRISIPATGVWR